MFHLLFISLFVLFTNVYAQLLTVSDLTFDENDRLDYHMFLYSHEKCEPNHKFQSIIDTSPLGQQFIYDSISGELEQLLLGTHIEEHASSSNKNLCSVIVLERGCNIDQLHYPKPEYTFHMPSGSDKNKGIKGTTGLGSKSMQEISLNSWLSTLTVAEVGWVSYYRGTAKLYWIDDDNERHPSGTIRYGEKETLWISSRLGHRFEIVGEDGSIWWTNDYDVDENLPMGTQEGNIVSRIQDVGVRHHTVHRLGDPKSGVRPSMNHSKTIYRALKTEWSRSRVVKRSYTELGFAHSKLPLDLYTSMSTYYYNNAQNYAREEWEDKGVFVNWWQADCFMIGMPWGLKKYWQGRLKTLVEQWIGGKVPLELTDIYGMRRYENGASLLAHVDREETHAVSLIINVAQGGMRKPWNIEIYDHADRLHEMEMQPGDIVFYESAKALHSRTDPLQGDYYVNLFSHYRPVGDNRWYLKQNPPDTPKQLLDIGECSVDDENAVHCTKADIPSLSPKLQTIRSGDDVFKYWQSVMLNHPKTISSVRNDAKPSDFDHNEL